MASTFRLQSISTYGGRYMTLNCLQSRDVANNKSTITWTLVSEGGSSEFYTTGPTTVTINGTQVYHIARKGWTTKVFPAKKGSVSGTLDIYHDDDGSKTISVSLSTAIYEDTVRTDSGNWELDFNPRQAELTAAYDEFTDTNDPYTTLAVNPTIWYSNPAGNAVESLQACISFTGATDDIRYRDVDKLGKEYTFSLTEEERNVLRNNTTLKSREIIFFLRTIIAGKTYYSTLNKRFVVNDSSITKPAVSIAYTLNNSSLPDNLKEICIQGKSRLDVTLRAEGKYNASIVSLWADVDSRRYGGETFTTDVLPLPGRRTLTAYVIDTRGHQNSDSKTIDVVPYSPPFLLPVSGENAILCHRADSNGKRVGNSKSVWVKVKRVYSPIITNRQHNYCAVRYRYKESTAAWNDADHKWTDLISTSDSTDTFNGLIPDIEFDLKKSYNIQIRVIDDLGEYDFKTFDIPTQDVALHLGKEGKNVSVGSYCDYSEGYTFHSEWKAIFDNGIKGSMLHQDVEGDILTFALGESCGEGTTLIYTKDNTTNLPSSGNYRMSSGFIQKRNGASISVFLTDCDNGDIAVNVYVDEVWKGWKFLRLQ